MNDIKMIYTTAVIFGAKYLIALICLFFVWFFFRQGKEQRKEIFVSAFLILPITFIVAKIANHFFIDPRPFVQDNFVPLIAHATDNGFPSDHTLFASALAVVAFISDRQTGLILLLLTIIVGASRVLAGVHHAIDIIGAILIAIIVGWLINRFVLPKIIK